MDVVRRTELKKLIEIHRGPCVTIFMPTHVAETETQQDPIRLRNLIQRAQLKLDRQGLPSDVVESVLRPVRDLIDQYLFWQHQKEGLALFSAPGSFHKYAVPFEVPELAIVANHFHVKPLFRVADVNSPYYLLGLGQNGVRLYRGSPEGLLPSNDVALPASPLAPADHAHGDGRALQCHAPNASGRHFRIFHGHGGREERRKQLMSSYFRSVDDIVRNHVDEATPLVLAGVTYLCALYRNSSRACGLAGEEIHGNPDHITLEELNRRSSEIASSFLQSLLEKTADEYYRLWHTPRASNDMRDIADAARDGRVKTLFVAVGGQESACPQDIPEDARTSSQDLLNIAALDTFLTGGRVFAVAPNLVPGHGSAAAVFRY